jgi:hypothetical protein
MKAMLAAKAGPTGSAPAGTVAVIDESEAPDDNRRAPI